MPIIIYFIRSIFLHLPLTWGQSLGQLWITDWHKNPQRNPSGWKLFAYALTHFVKRSKGNYKTPLKLEYELILFSFPLSIILLAVMGIMLIIPKNWNIKFGIINMTWGRHKGAVINTLAIKMISNANDCFSLKCILCV